MSDLKPRVKKVCPIAELSPNRDYFVGKRSKPTDSDDEVWTFLATRLNGEPFVCKMPGMANVYSGDGALVELLKSDPTLLAVEVPPNRGSRWSPRRRRLK